jgi:transposase
VTGSTRATARGPTGNCCVGAASPTPSEPRDQQANRVRRGSRGGRPVGFDKQRYQRRNVVERGFNQLKQWRGIASRTDKHAINYRGGITFRATLAWIS